jgi:hypothetical protein
MGGLPTAAGESVKSGGALLPGTGVFTAGNSAGNAKCFAKGRPDAGTIADDSADTDCLSVRAVSLGGELPNTAGESVKIEGRSFPGPDFFGAENAKRSSNG